MSAERRPGSRRGGVDRSAGERRHKGSTRSQQIERRAQWVLERWAEKPSLRYGAMRAEIVKQFECGERAAELAIARAYELLAEYSNESGVADRIAAGYWELHEQAKVQKDFAEARHNLDSLREMLGVGSAKRLELSGGMSVTQHAEFEDLSDEDLAELAAAGRAERSETEH